MQNGAKKYGPYNWRATKVRATVYIAAGLRHLLEYLDGADYSTDTNPPVHHLGHAKACMGIVLDALETGNLVDDRPGTGAASRLLVAHEEPDETTTAAYFTSPGIIVKCNYCRCGKLKPLGHETCGCIIPAPTPVISFERDEIGEFLDQLAEKQDEAILHTYNQRMWGSQPEPWYSDDLERFTD